MSYVALQQGQREKTLVDQKPGWLLITTTLMRNDNTFFFVSFFLSLKSLGDHNKAQSITGDPFARLADTYCSDPQGYAREHPHRVVEAITQPSEIICVGIGIAQESLDT